MYIVTYSNLRDIMPAARQSDIEDFCAPINSAMREFEINTGGRQAAFLAQCAEESNQLWHLRDHYHTQRGEEYADGKTYEGRADLGNTQPGWGVLFKGHGLLQTTGAENHRKMAAALDIDCFTHPELLCEPDGASRSAGCYWKSKGLNELADQEDFTTITRRINGGINGLEERQQFWARAKQVFV